MPPPAPRYTLETPFGNILIKVRPARKVSFALVAYTLLWLLPLPVVSYFIFAEVDSIPLSTAWLLAAVALVVVARVAPAVGLLWRQLAGSEIIEISPQAVKVQSINAGIRRTKEYQAGSIRRITAAQPRLRVFAFLRFNLASFEVPATGPIVLDHDGREIRLGFGLDQQEGEAIVEAIHARMNKYR